MEKGKKKNTSEGEKQTVGILVCGLNGTGKSTLGRILAVRLGYAFIDNEDGSIRVRLRSRFTTVDKLGNKYHGGGHAKAAGGTVYSKSEMKALIADADAICKEFKENNFYL